MKPRPCWPTQIYDNQAINYYNHPLNYYNPSQTPLVETDQPLIHKKKG